MITWLTGLANWLDATSFANSLRSVSWAVPMIQTLHILAIAVVFSSALLVALSTLGALGDVWSPARWSRRLNAWSWSALAVLAVSGTLMVASEPARSLLSVIFQVKMLLVTMTVILLGQLTRRVRPPESRAGPGVSTAAKVLAVLSVINLVAIIAAGRWIAYYSGS